MVNTHNYDGRLDISLLPDLATISELTIEEKIKRGRDIRAIAVDVFDSIPLKYLDLIISSIGTASNVDHTNGLVADDLLCICWVYRENPNFMIELETQLNDMSTGFCPQGRTHRLFQVLVAFS